MLQATTQDGEVLTIPLTHPLLGSEKVHLQDLGKSYQFPTNKTHTLPESESHFALPTDHSLTIRLAPQSACSFGRRCRKFDAPYFFLPTDISQRGQDIFVPAIAASFRKTMIPAILPSNSCFLLPAHQRLCSSTYIVNGLQHISPIMLEVDPSAPGMDFPGVSLLSGLCQSPMTKTGACCQSRVQSHPAGLPSPWPL